MNSKSGVDDYPSNIYNVNYIATWSVKERKSSFHNSSIACDRTENEINDRDSAKHSLEADPVQSGSFKLWLQGKLRLSNSSLEPKKIVFPTPPVLCHPLREAEFLLYLGSSQYYLLLDPTLTHYKNRKYLAFLMLLLTHTAIFTGAWQTRGKQ